MQIAALLTGRGNNTLKDKNLLKVNGYPLLSYPCKAAANSKYINSLWASSDCSKILKVATRNGFKSIIRPKKIAQPNSQHIDAIDHSLDEMKKQNYKPNILVVMMANSVTIKTKWIDSCISMFLEDKSATAVVPVYKEMDHHPYRSKKINDNGYLDTFFDFTKKKISTNRQDLEPAYFLSHNFWVLNLDNIDREKGQKPWVFMGDKIKHFLVEGAFDVHTLEDLKKCEKWLNENNINYDRF